LQSSVFRRFCWCYQRGAAPPQDVRSGLTGYAQAYGRKVVTWEDKFKIDV